MKTATGLTLVAIGAILAFAVDVTTRGFDINTIGVILMIVGGIGLLASLIAWNSWGGFHSRRVVYDDGVPAARRRRVYEDEVV